MFSERRDPVLHITPLLLMGLLLFVTAAGCAQVDSRPDQSPDAHSADVRSVSISDKAVFLPFVKRVAEDQREFWGKSRDLTRPATLEKIFPFAAAGALLIAADSSLSNSVPPSQVKRSQDISNYATLSLAGAAGSGYMLGRFTHNDHLQETGYLSAEAALNSVLITYALQRATMRQTPDRANGNGAFVAGGSSFPSAHSALAWSLASVMAQEYPGPLTRLLAYGLASGVTLTRVTGKQHFPSDVLLGSALGWYFGRQVYRARHNPQLPGSFSDDLDDREYFDKGPRPPARMGSPYVPLDNWVYPAIERLAAFGYIQTAFTGLKPWTRMECAQLTAQAQETMLDAVPQDLLRLESALHEEFAYEFRLLDGEPNRTARLQSVYTRMVSISGPALTESDHFGQTISYDFGRPFRRGTNAQLGGTFSAALGPAAIFMRAEFQHAPSASALSDAARNFIAARDLVPVAPATGFDTINRPTLLDTYVALNLRDGWQLSFGKQSLSWAPGPGGSLLWSDNIEPIPMLRLTQSETLLPGFLRVLGPVRVESFVGRLEGHTYIPHPYIYGNKINFKPLPGLELGFGRSVTIGGKGGDPLTAKNFYLSFFGRTTGPFKSVPGDSHSGFDWTFYLPKMRNYLVFYGDWYADDDIVAFQNPAKNPFRTGLHVTRLPRLPKLDVHIEAASTESSSSPAPATLNYWNIKYRDGYTNNGDLIGNTVGRDGRSMQCWFNYWISPRNSLQFTYKHNSLSKEFVPKGAAWQDYRVGHDITFASGVYARSQLQFEHISRFPILFSGSQMNIAAIVELGFIPHKSK